MVVLAAGVRRHFVEKALSRCIDLALTPTGDFWARPDGLAMLWVMTGTQSDDSLGAAARGRTWSAEGLSYLVFDGLRVVREADYHDKGSRARSLGVTP